MIVAIISMSANSFTIGDFEYEIISNSNLKLVSVSQYTGTDDAVVIPTSVDYKGVSYRVTKIGESVFENHTDLTDIVFPETLKEIGPSAFKGCLNLWVLNFPATLTKIGKYAFSGLVNFQTLCFPNSKLEVGDYAFENCSDLCFILIPNNVKQFDNYVFNDDMNIIAAFCPGAEGFSTRWHSFENINPDAVMYVPLYYMENYYTLSCFPRIISRTAPAVCLNMLGTCCMSGESFNIQVHAYAYPDAEIESVEWFSKNGKIVTINQDGAVTAISPGTTDIFCIVTDNKGQSASATCTIVVEENTGIESVCAEFETIAVQFFTLQGLPAGGERSALEPGIYIRRQGKEVSKIIVK